MRIPILLGLAACYGLAGDTLDPKTLLQPPTCTLVVFGPARARDTWRRLLVAEAVVDVRVALRAFDPASRAGRQVQAALREQQGLEGVVWCLIRRGGGVLGSGRATPDPSVLAELLEAGGEANQTRTLARFLEAHPDHLEARLRLLKRLARQVPRRLEAIPEATRTPEDDVFLWGGLARHLEDLLKDPSWPSVRLDLDALLGPDLPERTSQVMRDLYARLRPEVARYLGALPEDGLAWQTLARMDRVSGESGLLPILEANPPLCTPYHASLLPAALPRLVLAEARRDGKLQRALPILRALWEAGRFHLLEVEQVFDQPEPGAAPRSPRMEQRGNANLMELWNAYLGPYLEALLDLRRDGEATATLAGLDERWRLVNFGTLAVRMAKAQGRPDLASSWARVAAGPLPPAKPEGWGFPYFCLVHQAQGHLPTGTDCNGLAARGCSVRLVPVSTPWRKFLDWPERQPRWALVAPSGKVVLQGGTLPEAEDLLRQFLGSGETTPVMAVQVELTRQPDHLAALQTLALHQRMQVQAWLPMLDESADPADRTQGATLAVPDDHLVSDYLTTLGQVLGHPRGLVPVPESSWLGAWPLFDGPYGERLVKSGRLEEFAVRNLPRIEEELAKRPHDHALWSAWRSLAVIARRDLGVVLESLDPGPPDPREPWPPREIRADYMRLLMAGGRWPQVAALVKPAWEAFRDQPGGAGAGFNPEAWNDLVLPLAEALLRGNDPAGAEAVVQGYLDLKLHPGALGGLAALARDLGYPDLASKWQGLKTS